MSRDPNNGSMEERPTSPRVRKAVNVIHTNITADGVSRYDLLAWIKSTIGVNVKHVEDLCTGVIYCQLMEHLFGPGAVQMKRLKTQTNLENEYIQNFKILQMAFNKCGVDRAIPIERLVKGRYKDNYDYAQWFKMFYDANDFSSMRHLDIPKAKNDYPCEPEKVVRHSPKTPKPKSQRQSDGEGDNQTKDKTKDEEPKCEEEGDNPTKIETKDEEPKFEEEAKSEIEESVPVKNGIDVSTQWEDFSENLSQLDVS